MSKRAKNILFGFNAPEFSDNIVQDLRNRGETVNSQVCLSKREIKEFLVGHPEFRHVVLLETLYKEDGTTEMYSAEELARMTDTHNINIIVVLAGKHRGTNFMKTLYAANITSALFQDEKQGASEEMIISLILKRRSRRNARTYYGIDRRPIKYSAVGGEHIDVLSELGNAEYGQSVLERFLILTKGMPAGELGNFIENLPLDIKNELSRYEEFYILLDAVKRKGGNVKLRKPKKVEFGLYVPEENIFSEETENTMERTSFDKEIDMDDIFTNEEENEDDGLKNMDTDQTSNNVSEDVSPSEDSDIFDLSKLVLSDLDDEYEGDVIPKENENNKTVMQNMEQTFEADASEQGNFVEIEKPAEYYELAEPETENEEVISDEDEKMNKLLEEISRINKDTSDAYDNTVKSKEIGVVDFSTTPIKPKTEIRDLSALLWED